MAYEQVQWAIRQRVSGSEKLTLILLADYAHSTTGDIFPSLASLSKATGQNIKTVTANVQKLVERGMLIRTGRTAGDTSRVQVYRCNIEVGIQMPPKKGRNTPKNGPKHTQNRVTDHIEDQEIIPNPPGECETDLFGEQIAPELTFEERSAQLFFDEWNKLARAVPALPAVVAMPDHRVAALSARLAEAGAKDFQSASTIILTLVEKVRGSPFLCGEVKQWAAGPEWVLGPKNFVKTMERRNERETANHHTGPLGKSPLAAGQRAMELMRESRERAAGRKAGAEGRIAIPDRRG